MMKMMTIVVLAALLVLVGCTGKQPMRMPSLGNPCKAMVSGKATTCTAEAANDVTKQQACKFVEELGNAYCAMAQPPAESLAIKSGALVGCEYVVLVSRGSVKRAWLMYIESGPDRPELTPSELIEAMRKPDVWANKEMGWTLQQFQAAP